VFDAIPHPVLVLEAVLIVNPVRDPAVVVSAAPEVVVRVNVEVPLVTEMRYVCGIPSVYPEIAPVPELVPDI
jgi:hypothetical protein